MSEPNPTVPYGYCQCGCGQKTPLWTRNNTLRGWVKGQHRAYRPGHYHGRDLRREFLKRIEPNEDGCWVWQGTLKEKGYGVLKFGGRDIRAHRIAYELFKGPIPEGTELDHLCRVRNCVNPEHLEAVSHAENSRRSSPVRLDAQRVDEIRELLAEGELPKGLAARYGVHRATIEAIKYGRNWKGI